MAYLLFTISPLQLVQMHPIYLFLFIPQSLHSLPFFGILHSFPHFRGKFSLLISILTSIFLKFDCTFLVLTLYILFCLIQSTQRRKIICFIIDIYFACGRFSCYVRIWYQCSEGSFDFGLQCCMWVNAGPLKPDIL